MSDKNYFAVLNAINVNDKTEKKNGLTYLSWAWAWSEVKKLHPTATYTIYENADGWNYHTDGKTCWVKTGVTINNIEHIEYLPVMDYRNKSIPIDNITSFDVNKAIQRSLTKAVARHGLGLYIYAGEDLPEDTQSDMPEEEKIDPNKKIEAAHLAFLKRLIEETDTDLEQFLTYMDLQRLEDMTIEEFTNKAKPALEKKKKKAKK
ncbi:MAG: DUF1071 domain-containing protein [Bacteroidales bacterium]